MTKTTPAIDRNAARNSARKNLQRIPGVGPSIADDLLGLGITAVNDLRGRDPEVLYTALGKQAGQHADRCVLYVFRCAVWFAEHNTTNKNLDPEKLKWWNWKEPS